MEIFPKEIRSSFHGVSAGMGKLGALLGSLLFTQLNSISISLTFLACIMSCFLGVVVTWRFIDPPKKGTFFVRGQPAYEPHTTDDEHIAITSQSLERITSDELSALAVDPLRDPVQVEPTEVT